MAGTADCGARGEDAGSAAGVLTTPAPLPDVPGTTWLTMVLVFPEPSLPVLVLRAGTPEVTSPPRDNGVRMSWADVWIVSPDLVANAAEVATRGTPAVAVADPNVRSLGSSLALDLVVAPAGRTTAEETEPAMVRGALSEPPVAEVTAKARRSDSSLGLELIVVPAGGTTADETAPAVLSERLLGPWVAEFTPVLVD